MMTIGDSSFEIRNEVDTFLSEGHNTTASGMIWTLYFLAQHPEYQERVYKEVIGVLDIWSGSLVAIQIYFLHHNTHVWEDPLEFRPERYIQTVRRTWIHSNLFHSLLVTEIVLARILL